MNAAIAPAPATEPADALEIVVYGIINAGKSSLINALAGGAGRPTGPIGGTTAEVVGIDWRWAEGLGFDSLEAPVRLVDTPGLEEVDQAGADRGELATRAAEGAALILFVLAEDLTATARAALVALRQLGKPMVVAVNKVDLLDDAERAEVVAAVRLALAGVVPPEHVVEVAAAPVVRRRVAGSSRVEVVRGEPDVILLRDLLGAILAESRADLRALAEATLAAERHVLARDADRGRLRARAERVADETSAVLALAMAANPMPVVGFLAGPGGLAVLVHRVAAVYGEPMTAAMARNLAGDLLRAGSVRLWGSLAGTIAGGFLKAIPGLGTVAGAVGQGASAGYFGHVVGRALVTYLENGKDWGDGGLLAELDRVAAATDKRAITQGLVDRIKARLRPGGPR